MVHEKGEHGWWLGSSSRNGTLHKGYFPKNYVRPKPETSSAPAPPPRPSALIQKAEEQALSESMKAVSVSSAKAKRSAQSFSVRSLAAFDDLTELGVAVEVTKPSVTGGALITNGMKVEIECHAMIWDGASTATTDFSRGKIQFIVGAGQVTAGLDLALCRLRAGDSATVTCNPSMAYGEAGNPPMVPPSVYIVYKLEVLSAVASDGSGASGPAELLASGISSAHHPRGGGISSSDRRGSKVTLENPAAKASK